MEEKVEQQTETRDMTERVEEMLSAIDAACSEIDRQTEGDPALTPETVADVGAQLATDLAGEPSSEPEPPGLNEADDLNVEQSELADADAGFVMEDLIEPSEPQQAVNAAAEALRNAVESADDLSNDIAALAGALAGLKSEEAATASPAITEPEPAAAPVEDAVPIPTPPASNHEPQSIEELDSELASLADAALEGAFEDAAGLQTLASVPPAQAPQAPPGSAPVERDLLPTSAASIEATEPIEPSPTPQPVRPSVSAPPPPGAEPEPEPEPEPTAPPVPSEAARVTQAPPDSTSPTTRSGRFGAVVAMARVVEPGARKVWLAARPTLASAVIVISKPAERLSASKRDTIGWFAVYTAFLAVCVWGFVLLFRKPSVPTPNSDPVGILGEAAASEDS